MYHPFQWLFSGATALYASYYKHISRGLFSYFLSPLLSLIFDKTIQHVCPHELIVFTVDQEKNNDFYEANSSQNEMDCSERMSVSG